MGVLIVLVIISVSVIIGLLLHKKMVSKEALEYFVKRKEILTEYERIFKLTCPTFNLMYEKIRAIPYHIINVSFQYPGQGTTFY